MTTKKTSPNRKRPAKSEKSTAGRNRERELAERRDYLFTDACETIIELAEKFERKINWIANGDNLDYLEELEKFETNVRKRLHLDKP